MGCTKEKIAELEEAEARLGHDVSTKTGKIDTSRQRVYEMAENGAHCPRQSAEEAK